MKPTAFTAYEGGEWLPWSDGEIPEKELQQRDPYAVQVGPVMAHSLLFEGNRRWDCINGWTR